MILNGISRVRDSSVRLRFLTAPRQAVQTSTIRTPLVRAFRKKEGKKRTAGARDPRHVQQDIVLEISAIDAAGCILGTGLLLQGGLVEHFVFFPRKILHARMRYQDQLGPHHSPPYITIASNAKGNVDANALKHADRKWMKRRV